MNKISKSKGFLQELWQIFTEAFYPDYNTALFCNSHRNFGIENRKFIGHYIVLLILVIIAVSAATYYSAKPEIPEITYANGSLISTDFMINNTKYLLAANQSLQYDFNGSIGFSDGKQAIEIREIGLSEKQELSALYRFIQDNGQNKSLMIFGKNFFVIGSYYNNDLSASVQQVENLEFKEIMMAVLFLAILLAQVAVFFFATVMTFFVAMLYITMSAKNISYKKALKYSFYSFIPATIINTLIFILTSINIYVVIVMLFYVFSSIIRQNSYEVF